MRWNIFRTNRSQNRTVASAAPAAPNGGVGGVGGAGNPSASRRRGRLIEKAAAEVGDVEAATSHRLSRKPRPPPPLTVDTVIALSFWSLMTLLVSNRSGSVAMVMTKKASTRLGVVVEKRKGFDDAWFGPRDLYWRWSEFFFCLKFHSALDIDAVAKFDCHLDCRFAFV